MKFKNGDKVKIKNLVAGQYYGDKLVKYSPLLKKYAGNIFTIDVCYEDDRYSVESYDLEGEEIDGIFLTPVIEKIGEIKFGDIATTGSDEEMIFFGIDGAVDKFGEFSFFESNTKEDDIRDCMPEIEQIKRDGEIIYTNVREMTLEEVEEALGYKVSIIDI